MPPRYLRVSLTARCNLRCFYCRPQGDCAECDGTEEPTPDQLGLLVRCAAAEGVRKVRLTGGEPLERADLEAIARIVSATAGINETTLTTNGIGLDRRAEALMRAGLGRANVSLDTLRPDRFARITGHDRLGEVLAGIDAAVRAFEEVKLNTVLLRGINDDEIEPLVRFAAERGICIRFIERYGSPGSPPASGDAVSAEEVKRRLRRAFGPLERLPSPPLSVEESYALPQAGGARVGIIAAASHPPCCTCAKLRFTAEGRLQACLFAPAEGDDLRPLLRRGDEQAIRSAIRDCFAAKRAKPASRRSLPEPVNRIGG